MVGSQVILTQVSEGLGATNYMNLWSDLGLSSYLRSLVLLCFPLFHPIYFSPNLPQCVSHSGYVKTMFLNACSTLKAVCQTFLLLDNSTQFGGENGNNGDVASSRICVNYIEGE